MSTDNTAFALGLLALLGRHAPERLRGFILTLTVVDDIVGLVVIATVYTHHLTASADDCIALMSLAVFAAPRIHFGLLYVVLRRPVGWPSRVRSRPGRRGTRGGLIAYAAPPPVPPWNGQLDLFRDFLNSRRPGWRGNFVLACGRGVPNDRLQQLWHPWTSYVIVPLFGLANAGIPIMSGSSEAYTRRSGSG